MGERVALDPDAEPLRFERDLRRPVQRHAVATLAPVRGADDVEARRHLPQDAPPQTVVLVRVGAVGERRYGTFLDSHGAEATYPRDMNTISFDRLSPTIGAEVGNIDLRETLDDATVATLRAGLLEHKVLFFREQAITSEQHLDFGRYFGDLEIHPVTPKDQEHREILLIQHDEGNRGSQNTWHSDVTWRPEPSLGSILRARVVPDVGGDTLFADMHGAYEGLPDKIRHRLDGLSAIHDFTRVFGRRFNPEVREQMQRKYPSVEHPVVRTHPETGRQGHLRQRRVHRVHQGHGRRGEHRAPEAAVPAGRHPRVPMPVAVAERHARVLGQPFHPALRRLRLLAHGARDGARHGRRRPSVLNARVSRRCRTAG